jgi:hypothetical protein
VTVEKIEEKDDSRPRDPQMRNPTQHSIFSGGDSSKQENANAIVQNAYPPHRRVERIGILIDSSSL